MDANLYWRDNWEPPRKSRRDQLRFRGCANRPSCDSNSAEERPSRAVASGMREMREGLRIVPLVAGCTLAVFALIAMIELATTYGGALMGVSPQVRLAQPVVPAVMPALDGEIGEPEGISTPKSQWQAGVLPFLYQTDPAWSSVPYSTDTIGTAGCGPTCLSMVYIALTGRHDCDPAALAAFSESHGYLDDNLTSWRLMSEGAAELGLVSHEVAADADLLRAELQAGHPVICSVRPGDFTTKGHFIVLAGIAENGEVVVHDPNSPTRSSQTWDLQRVLDQCRNLWSFERV